MTKHPNRWRRYDVWDERGIAQDRFAALDPEYGFAALRSPYDPAPSLVIEAGRVVLLDGVAEPDFDMIDTFIARHHIDVAVAPEAMATGSAEFARMMVDVNVPRSNLVRLATGMTPAKLAEVAALLNVAELTFAQAKLRARRTPGNQAHVTNAKDDPLQMAADAATAALYGFDELETTVRVARNARTNALALTVGAAVAREGVLVQCSVEEAEELRLGLAGLTSYTETMSVYGTERTFIDGDDTPWSKAFLTAAYTSRGLKARSTSGSGAELLMAFHEKRSTLYLEARCLCVQRAMGVQGTQNGGIDGAPITASIPGGVRAMLAENVLAALLDLECASGNDTRHSASDIRVGAKIAPTLAAGTDLICSGFGSIADYDNSFGASSFNAEEIEDFLALQRDFLADGGLAHVDHDVVVAARRRALDAIAAVLEELGLARVDDAMTASVVHAHGSAETSTFSLGQVAAMNEAMAARGIGLAEVIGALARRGFAIEAERLAAFARQRAAGDYLQTAAVIRDGRVLSAVNDPNDYAGPGTGHVPSPARQAALARMRETWTRERVLDGEARLAEAEARRMRLAPKGIAAKGDDGREVVVALGPGFGTRLHRTTGDVALSEVLRALVEGIEEAGGLARVVRVRHTADTSFIGLTGARLAGSGVGIGVQGKGTCVIHRADLAPHTNLELFPQAPLITARHYRAIGANAARYALGERPEPVRIAPYTGALNARHHVATALLYALEAELVEADALPQDLEVDFHDPRV
ncbi:MAG: propanediol/glycerol family dehydratase large subunit [Alphaproteobacteria bacterium]